MIKNPGPGISGSGGHIESSSGIQISYDNNAVITGNTFDTPGAVDEIDNDEECIATQHDAGTGEPFHDTGTLTSATATIITDTAKSWSGSATSWASSDSGTYSVTPYLLLITGAGTGEYALISSHTTDTLTLSTPLTTVPSAGDHYVIVVPSSLDQTITNNTIVGARIGIELYAGAIGDIVSNNTLVNAGAIYLRGLDTATDSEHDVCWGNTVAYNSISNPNSEVQSWLAVCGSEYQSTAFGNMLRSNTIAGNGAAFAPGGCLYTFSPTGDYAQPIDGIFDGIDENPSFSASHSTFVTATNADSGQE